MIQSVLSAKKGSKCTKEDVSVLMQCILTALSVKNAAKKDNSVLLISMLLGIMKLNKQERSQLLSIFNCLPMKNMKENQMSNL